METRQSIDDNIAAFGQRLKYSREQANITKVEAAKHLSSFNLGRRVNARNIEYWEKLATPEEFTTPTKTRLPHPNEIIILVQLYQVNGLWVFLYHHRPDLKPAPPPENSSALYDHPPIESELQRYVLKKIKELSENELKIVLEAIMIVGAL